MNKHLSLRSGNPALTTNTFKNMSATSGKTMTIEGTVNKTAISLLLLILTAYWTWTTENFAMIPVGIIAGLILALATVFKKHWAPITVPLYALFEGLALGGISLIFETKYPGIVNQAVFLTFAVLGALLFAYKTQLIKATENFKLGIFAATGGIGLLYLVNFVMGFFGSGLSVIGSNSGFGILFSVGVVIIAALNLVLDFDFIEEASETNVPQYMEWYGAFGLLVTLIWLYLEILRLLAKLQSRK
jgi:uncharacterized YccA/Bax inhibitor family protein